MTALDLRAIARALGGEVSGRRVLAPGPQHSPKDRSLCVSLAPARPFLVHSFAGDDPIQCKDYVSRRPQPEAQIQRAVFQHFRARGAPGVFAFHPANGGFRRPVEAAILKGLGVRAGVPDLIACRSGRFYALELKTDTGKLSDAQEQMLAALREAGAEVAVTYGLDAALAQLERWQLLRGVAS
jgi:hypothetical protein